MKKFRFSIWFTLLGFGLSSCAITSPFNQVAYEQATSLKVDVLSTMDNAAEPFAAHKTEVQQVTSDLKKAFEYAKGRPNNEESTRQWAIMQDPNRNLLGGFLKRWEEKSTLSPAFIEGAKTNVADGFDQIIGLESGKIKPRHVKLNE
jgi:hypothetical protein